MGINYSKGPFEEDVDTDYEYDGEDQSPWLTILKDVFRTAGRILCTIAKASYHAVRGLYYGAKHILRGLFHIFKGLFYSVQGIVYFLVGFLGKQGTALLLASLAVVCVAYYIYTKDPTFANQHVQIIQNQSVKMGDFVNKTSGDVSSKVGDLSSKLGDLVNKDDVYSKVGGLSSKLGDFVSKGKNGIWEKFEWSK